MKNRKEIVEKVSVIVAFTFFVSVTLYKLTNASLWFDEAIEYWYSKVYKGMLSFDDGTSSMFERINNTFQPPLYNVIMHFWLKINDGQWWFRFFGVVMGLICSVGIFKSVRKITDSTLIASGTIVVTTCVFNLLYYWQECAEYCLMLGTMAICIYFWIKLYYDVNIKNIILFTISSIMPVYSQYGAVFIVVVLLISAFVKVLLVKEKKLTITIILAYLSALLLAALPLYLFFLNGQFTGIQGSVKRGLIIEKNILFDFGKILFSDFKWNLANHCSSIFTLLLFIIFIIGMLIAFIYGKRIYRWLVSIFVISWILYYIAVKLELYSYGYYASRYNLFFSPFWIILFAGVCYENYRLLKNEIESNKKKLYIVYAVLLIVLMIIFCITSIKDKIINNWNKEDTRGMTKIWYEEKGYEAKSLIYFKASPGFAYYIRQNDQFDENYENNVTYLPTYCKITDEECLNMINEIYNNELPEKVFIMAIDGEEDPEQIARVLENEGYNVILLYDDYGKLFEAIK